MLELQNITYKVTGGSRSKILDHLSHVFKSGTLTVITGPNGSGKSTLAEIIMGIKNPTSGKILFNHQNITTQDITTRAKSIAYAFQQPVHLKGITVYDLLNIASGALISSDEATKQLKKVGLSADYLTREIDTKLSGGELKRIEIASVLTRDTDLIIFDEPEAGIDLWSFDNLIKVFKKLKSAGKTLIIISHQEKILKLADEIIILEDGKIKSKGTPEKILLQITADSNKNKNASTINSSQTTGDKP